MPTHKPPQLSIMMGYPKCLCFNKMFVDIKYIYIYLWVVHTRRCSPAHYCFVCLHLPSSRRLVGFVTHTSFLYFSQVCGKPPSLCCVVCVCVPMKEQVHSSYDAFWSSFFLTNGVRSGTGHEENNARDGSPDGGKQQREEKAKSEESRGLRQGPVGSVCRELCMPNHPSSQPQWRLPAEEAPWQ